MSPAQAGSLRVEHLANPQGLDERQPRFRWTVGAQERGQRQTAYRLLVASTPENLKRDKGDLWDSGKVESDQTTEVVYAGKPLTSRQSCFWKVQIWSKDGKPSGWSEPARWTMGLLDPADWQAEWISFRDTSPLHQSRDQLYLPPARYYRKGFEAKKAVKRATIHATALGIYELHLNGQRVSEDCFAPGWPDYRKRGYYQTYDVTPLVKRGSNAVGAIVADGWYSGYVGYGLLVGYGPNKVGRYFYGKTPALMAQLEIEYTNGKREVIATDTTWKVTGDGPIREADFIMGESYDARRELKDWAKPGFDAKSWEAAIRAADNGSTKAVFSDNTGNREVELGFVKPPRLEAYPAQPVRPTELVNAVGMTEPQKGVYIFNLGQNFAGVIRLRVRGQAGTQVKIRYGEMLHTDGRLMTENLRRARATDFYTLRGDPKGEEWIPRFTYHGFQYVELTGLPGKPPLDAVTGIVLGSDTPLVSAFECSDDLINRLYKNVVWTQRANFVELPTDCPQRDERLGWMGDAQVYARTATYNADVSAFFTKWMREVEEAQLPNGAYPDYCPYPMGHGSPGKCFGTAWTDAGIICPWTMYHVYGDKRIIERHYASMKKFMDFRKASSPDFLGVSIGNTWGDWLSLGEETPIEYIDTIYFAYTAKLMAEMAEAVGKTDDAAQYRQLFANVQAAYLKKYVTADGTITVATQTAQVLPLYIGLLPEELAAKAAARLVAMIEKNDVRMATGFLGTRPLLTVLTAAGYHDLAVRLLQSRKFPSWGYEVVNGATSIWERWNSFTKDKGFGENNAAMNSFSHYSFGAVCEWMFHSLAGIDTDGPGFRRLLLRPGPPTAGSNPDQTPIDWVKAEYRSIHGRIASAWKRDGGQFEWQVTVPANTRATAWLPASAVEGITEGNKPLDQAAGVKFLRMEKGKAVIELDSGSYAFSSKL